MNPKNELMKQWHKFLLILCIGVSVNGISYARPLAGTTGDTLITFRFLSGKDGFFLQGNEAELRRLYMLVDTYRTEIAAGTMPVYVDGYCSSLPTVKENLNMAFIRANRVKSEIIMQKELKEENFVTANHARTYNDKKDVVVITLRIPEKVATEARPSEEPSPDEIQQQQSPVVKSPKPEPAVEKEPEQTQQPEPAAKQISTAIPKPYSFAIRTNVLYDAFLLPTIGLEWRVNRSIGIKVDGSFSWWSGESGKVQKTWLLNPEVRWYMGNKKRIYIGAAGNYGEYNIYKYPIGNLFPINTGYQGKLWNAGVTVGYQLFLSRSFSLDFNLGLGYTHSEYDGFELANEGMRLHKERNKTKSFWGPTQAGISLMWTIGRNK